MTTARKITVMKNDFHGTEYRTVKTREELTEIIYALGTGRETDAQKAFVRQVRKALCGIEGCLCGTNVFDER